MNYYNEFDPHAAAWLRELIAQKLIPAGVVDERSITDVSPTDLSGFAQCHFFAGIGGWPLALSLAGWPADEPAWTGSCPCQPFSAAGKQMGRRDPRHLWPAFRRLINRCRPPVVFGEQVASADGRRWLSGVFANLETMGYAPAGADLCAAGVGAPHIRQRLFWVADSTGIGRRAELAERTGCDARDCPEERPAGFELCGNSRRMGNADMSGRGKQCWPGSVPQELVAVELRGNACGMADADGGHAGTEREQCGGEQRQQPCHGGGGFWSDSRWLACRDGKHRRVPAQPALFPLADGLPYKLARRGSIRPALLKGAGNAIVPEVAAQFIRAFHESRMIP